MKKLIFSTIAIVGGFSLNLDIALAYTTIPSQETVTNPSSEMGISTQFDDFGISIDIDNGYLLIGSRRDRTMGLNSGAAYLYDLTSESFVQTFFEPEVDGRWFGKDVSLSGNKALIGNNNTSGNRVRLFNIVTGDLLHTFANPGGSAYIGFGANSAMSNNNIVISAPAAFGGDGAVHIYDASSGDLRHTLLNPLENIYQLGNEVAVRDDYVLANSGVLNSPAGVHLFDASTGDLLHNFFNPTPDPTTSFDNDNFGESFAVDDNYIIIGSPLDDALEDDSGAAYLYDAITGELLRTLYNPFPSLSGRFGRSVDIDNNNILISAPGNQEAYVFDINSGELLHVLADNIQTTSAFGANDVAISGNLSAVGDTQGGPGSSGAVFLYQPVPEPLTILGAGTAIAFGTAFKRKLAKAKKK